MSDNKKKRIDEGFVPQKSPKKPVENKENFMWPPPEVKKGFVPPRLPKKPPTKPSNRKK